ncbi:testis-expressed protein 49 [Oryzias latipes]|uniref:testis-expressed protein 49 n=1 Tax=Oryzias latipes TaxID=8090 RepID=UPI0002A4AC95|nr:testis-expressed protein 49 [Oryzias latipes]
MSFFGLTRLGYQNPIGETMIHFQRASPSEDGVQVTTGVDLPLQENERTFPTSATLKNPSMHQKSNKHYREMVRQAQLPASPKDLYVMPLTGNQQYGWMVSDTPKPWTKINRFPRRNSDVSKFVEQMLMTDRTFCPF